jgi:hypothetical protein
MRRLKQLAEENAKLKKIVADLSLCEFRRNPARDSDLMSATVPI